MLHSALPRSPASGSAADPRGSRGCFRGTVPRPSGSTGAQGTPESKWQPGTRPSFECPPRSGCFLNTYIDSCLVLGRGGGGGREHPTCVAVLCSLTTVEGRSPEAALQTSQEPLPVTLTAAPKPSSGAWQSQTGDCRLCRADGGPEWTGPTSTLAPQKPAPNLEEGTAHLCAGTRPRALGSPQQSASYPAASEAGGKVAPTPHGVSTKSPQVPVFPQPVGTEDSIPRMPAGRRKPRQTFPQACGCPSELPEAGAFVSRSVGHRSAPPPPPVHVHAVPTAGALLHGNAFSLMLLRCPPPALTRCASVREPQGESPSLPARVSPPAPREQRSHLSEGPPPGRLPHSPAHSPPGTRRQRV